MQRWLMALGLLLFGAASMSLADYVVIRVILNNNSDSVPGTDPSNPGNPNGFGPPSSSNPMGGPRPMGGIVGMGSGTPKSANIGIPPGGNAGIGGGQVGFRGNVGGQVGNAGGPAPMGIMGGPMGNNMMGGKGLSSGETLTKLKWDPNSMVMVVVDLQAKPELRRLGGQEYPHIEHQFKGSTYLYNDELILVDILKKPSVGTTFLVKTKELAAKKTPDGMFDLAEWALKNGLVTECMKLMDDLVVLLDKDKDKITGRVLVGTEAYRKIKTETIDRQIAANIPDNSDLWKSALNYSFARRSDHYVLVHNSEDNAEVDRRLSQLEKNYKAVLVWFAMRGRVLPMPQTRLVAVLADKTSDLAQARDAFAPGTELVADGTFSQRENVAFLVNTRIDPTFLTFSQMTRTIENEGWSTKSLLKGEVPLKKGNERTKPEDAARAQTLVLVERALIDESEVSAVSRVGTRQILVASKMMPRYVHAPEWFDFGLPSFFETAKGPFSYETSQVKVAFWQGYGMPSWAYSQLYKEMIQGKKPDIDKKKAPLYLQETVSDLLFARAREPIPTSIPEELREKATQAKQKELDKARMLSWGLCHFLIRKHPAELDAFIRELDAMPRELDFDADAKLEAFARAFKLTNKDGKVDGELMKRLAIEWFLDMDTINSPVSDMKLDDPKVETPMGGTSGYPGSGFPGSGSPMSPMGGPMR